MPVSGKRKEGLAKCTNKVQKLYLYAVAQLLEEEEMHRQKREELAKNHKITFKLLH